MVHQGELGDKKDDISGRIFPGSIWKFLEISRKFLRVNLGLLCSELAALVKSKYIECKSGQLLRSKSTKRKKAFLSFKKQSQKAPYHMPLARVSKGNDHLIEFQLIEIVIYHLIKISLIS